MLQTLLRQPLAFLGAIGLLSMLKNVVTLHEDVLFLVNAYQSVTQPLWDFLVGWVFDWLKWPFPSWLKDYSTMGVICTFAMVRAKLVDHPQETKQDLSSPIVIPWMIALWPIFVAVCIFMFIVERNDPEERRYFDVFFEFLIWAFVIIAASYGLFLYEASQT